MKKTVVIILISFMSINVFSQKLERLFNLPFHIDIDSVNLVNTVDLGLKLDSNENILLNSEIIFEKKQNDIYIIYELFNEEFIVISYLEHEGCLRLHNPYWCSKDYIEVVSLNDLNRIIYSANLDFGSITDIDIYNGNILVEKDDRLIKIKLERKN